MLETNQNISEKTIWNAISAYLMIFISWLFLFNKSNPDINNPFVKSHTKNAMIIHLWFLVTYIIFISNWIFSSYNLFWFWINNIITDVIYILLLMLLINWIYKAKNKQMFSIWNDIIFSNNLLDINWDWKITEKEKITILLSYIPLIWFVNFAKNKNNDAVINWTKINLIFSLIITLLIIFWYLNLATLFILIYIISITFIWINLFSRNELISIKVPTILSPNNIYLSFKILIKYLINYFSNKDFKSYQSIKVDYMKDINDEKQNDIEKLKLKKDIKIPKFLIYIPFINLIFLFIKDTKYSFHIINWLMITLLTTILLLLSFFWNLNINISILLLFPILFWIWYLNNTLDYKIPIIFDTYLLFKKIFWLFKISSKKIKEKSKEENEINLKVKS